MGYRIEYDSFQREKPKTGMNGKRRLLVTVFFGALFLTGVYRHSPEGAEILDRLFQPDRWLLTRSALESLVSRLQCGEPLTDAVTAFCRELVQHGMAYGA